MLITPNFTFIHIPKTAGRFCRQHIVEHAGPVLYRGGLHAPHARVPNNYRHLPIITFIRNPWDWYVSWYFHMRNFGGFNPLFANAELTGRREFTSAMHYILDSIEENSEAARQLDQYIASPEHASKESHDLNLDMIAYQRKFNVGMLSWRFFFNVGLAPAVPCHVGKLESLVPDLIDSMQKCGVKLDKNTEHDIKTSARVGMGKERNALDYRRLYMDSVLIDRVGSKENYLIERFDYTFE